MSQEGRSLLIVAEDVEGESIGKIKRDALYFPDLPLIYILEGVKVGYFSSINQLFLLNSEFKTGASCCCANQFCLR